MALTAFSFALSSVAIFCFCFRLVAMYCFKNSYICSSVGGQPFRLHANPEVQLPTPSAPLFPRYPCPMQIFRGVPAAVLPLSAGRAPGSDNRSRHCRTQLPLRHPAVPRSSVFRNHSFSPISPIWRIESRVRSALPTPNSSAILTYGTSSGL